MQDSRHLTVEAQPDPKKCLPGICDSMSHQRPDAMRPIWIDRSLTFTPACEFSGLSSFVTGESQWNSVFNQVGGSSWYPHVISPASCAKNAAGLEDILAFPFGPRLDQRGLDHLSVC